MKRYNIICIGALMALGTNVSIYAQDVDEDTVPAKKAPVVKVSNVPTMEVKGTVVEAANNQPVAGIQVQTVGDNRYTAMTDENGEFTIKVPTYTTSLYVFGPEFLSQQVAISGVKNLKVKIIADHFKTMYKNGNTVTASPEFTVNNTTSQTVETDIEGNLGADVRAISRNGGPGYGSAMFIRGLNSLNSNAQPLVVIDGIIQDMQYSRTDLHYGDYSNLMLNINPADIDKVQVLKNGTALYGAKGGNGVILITTKRGHSMATRIDANVGVGVTLMPKLPEMMNASQYRSYASEMVGTHSNASSLRGETMKFLNTDKSKFYYNTYHNDTDWSDEVYETAMTQNYNVNVQGGDNVGMYNLSLGYTDGKSTAKENGFDRLNVRFNTDINVINKLTTKFDMSFAKINRNVFDNGAPETFSEGPVSSPTLLGLIKAPILSPYTYNSVTGQLSTTLADADNFLSELDDDELTLGNPTALLANGSANNKNRVETTHFNAVIAPSYEFSSALKLTETFSYDLVRISQRYYRPLGGMPLYVVDGIGTEQTLSESSFSKDIAVQSDTRLDFSKKFGAHSLDAYVGFRFLSFSYDENNAWGSYSSAGNDKMPNISASMDFKGTGGANDSWRNASWYLNADYNYRNLYFLQAAVSMETSSRFGENSDGLDFLGVKWGIFPSVQAGWLVSNEKWFPKNGGINYLMIKAGFDISGNDDINNYAARTSFSPYHYLNNAEAIQLDNIGNDKITYEKTSKFNVGFKSYLADNRIGIDFDYYIHHTSNLLTLKSFNNPVAGINRYWSNGGSLDNTGFEVTVTGKPVVSKNWNVEIGASVGHYKNKLKSLPDNSTISVAGQQVQGYVSSIYGTDNVATIVGQPIGLFYGYKTAGVFADDAAAKAANNGEYLKMKDETGADQYFKAGDMHFVDINNDGYIDENDKTIIGDPNPDIYGNIFASVSWKHLTLTVGFNYSLGNDVYNYQRSILESGSNFYNQTVAMASRWTTEGQVTDIPRIAYGDPMGNSRFSDRWVEDGSYLRLKTLNLTYNVPVNLSWLQGLAIWAEANNLFTITRYLGSDPECSASNSVLYQGIDTGNVPLSRTFTLGLKINL